MPKRFVKILEETNQAYRASFYDEIIDGLGFGVGAFIETAQRQGDGDLIDQKQAKIKKILNYKISKCRSQKIC